MGFQDRYTLITGKGISDQNEKYKRTNNDLQTIHIKLKLGFMNACILFIHLSNLEYLLIINDYYTNNLPKKRK
jgi:hypothetical protein